MFGRKTSTPGSTKRRQPSEKSCWIWSGPISVFALATNCWLTPPGDASALAKSPEVGVLTVSRTEAGRRDRVLSALPDPMTVLQWHGAEVTAIPANAEVLAKSDVCCVQAFRVGQHAYGFQCHVEITADTVGQWAAIPAYTSSLEDAMGKGGVAVCRVKLLNAFRNSIKTHARSMRASKRR